jgi:TetR/AcrR family transcriptional regulator, transcriptional repressor for nem operon
MPRPKSISRHAMLESALKHFWVYGFASSSMDDLVTVTGASRHALYSAFGNKDGLFAAAIDLYINTVVTPAFAQVEAPQAGLREISNYWEYQIARGAKAGLPGPGCLIANTMTERAPHTPEILRRVTAHNERLCAGFRNAVRGPGIATRHQATTSAIEGMAVALTIFSNGLWSYSRAVSNPRPLRLAAKNMISNLST